MSKRAERRQRIELALEDFRYAIGRALGVAEQQQERAATAHARAMVELWLRTDGIDRALANPEFTAILENPAMSELITELNTERDTHFADWAARGPSELSTLVAEQSPGVASAPGDAWLGQPGTADGMGTVPALWRIGTAVADSAPEQLPFPVAIPLLDTAHLQISSTFMSRPAAEAIAETLVLRVLSFFRPGLVHIHIWDTGQLTGSLPGLYPLTRAGLLTVHDSARPQELLDELSDHIRRVHTGVLTSGQTSVRAVSERAGRRTEPWRIAVLFGNRTALKEEHQQQLQRIARNGLPCGIQLVLVDVPVTVNSPMETVTLNEETVGRTSMSGKHATFSPDPPLPRAAVPAACAEIAAELERQRARLCTFVDLLPKTPWTETSAAGLVTPVGYHDGMPVEVILGDSTPHALIGGPSGSGKTNFLYAMLGGLAARYSPDELELYLLDFKEGVSFAQFTPGRKDPSWLPHARLVGVNVNADREFGLALLSFLADKLRERADIAKQHEVTKLEELRTEDPSGRWPRIVAVIDEFQYLFSGRDAVTAQAAQLLEDVARRGRSQGIHVVLASQDVSGIEAFWGKPAIFEQFSLRIALPKARRVLADLNEIAADLPRWHAVINHESGQRHGNQTARIPNATSKGTFDELQRQLYQRKPASLAFPRLFDGAHEPTLTDAADFINLRPTTEDPVALLGQVIDVAGSAARITLAPTPGRNLAVISSTLNDADSVFTAAARSLAAQHEPGSARFTLCVSIADATPAAQRLATDLEQGGHEVTLIDTEGMIEMLAAEAQRLAKNHSANSEAMPVPHYLFGYAIDAAQTQLENRAPGATTSGLEHLQHLLKHGAEHRTHVLGWWRGVSRLRASLPFGAVDDIGSWVAFDAQGQELSTLAAGQLVNWSPRPARGLFFDRFTHAHPQVIIPFRAAAEENTDA